MDAYVKDLEAGKAPNEEMMRWVLQRYNAVRRWLFIALQHHADAFRYWALRDSTVRFSVEQKAGELCAALARVISDNRERLEDFKPAPQDFFAKRIEIADAAMLRSFASDRRLVVPVTLDEDEFSGKDRVRLGAVRVWLDGVASTRKSGVIRVMISAAGAYRDRLGASTFEFVPAWPLEFEFEYRIEANRRTVITDGAFATKYRPSFFEPTPFTTWTVVVTDKSLNLTTLEKVVLEFDGNSIARV